jgi:hypothetical protein
VIQPIREISVVRHIGEMQKKKGQKMLIKWHL